MNSHNKEQDFKVQDSQPWYKNYMVTVFVIGLPLFVVIACIGLVFYSFHIKDSVVRDDWYMDGKTLYQDASRDMLTHDLGLQGDMQIDDNGQVVFYLNYPQSSIDAGQLNNGAPLAYPEELSLSISHATHVDKDRDAILVHQDGTDQSNKYVATIDTLDPLVSKYYIQVSNDVGSDINTDSHNETSQAVSVAGAEDATISEATNTWRMRQVAQLPSSTEVHFEPLHSFD